jgi:hypothetical protein
MRAGRDPSDEIAVERRDLGVQVAPERPPCLAEPPMTVSRAAATVSEGTCQNPEI